MKGVIVIRRVVAALLVALPVLAIAGPLQDAVRGRSTDVVVSLDIPEEVSLQVDGEFVFDLSRVRPGREGDACVDRFPPPPGCAFTLYVPTGSTFRRALAAGAVADARSVLISVVDNLPGGTLHVRHSISLEWEGGDPGISTSAVQSAPAGSSRREDFRPIPTTPQEFLSMAVPQAPSRVDRAIRLVLPRDAKLTATPKPVTARITYEAVHSPS